MSLDRLRAVSCSHNINDERYEVAFHINMGALALPTPFPAEYIASFEGHSYPVEISAALYYIEGEIRVAPRLLK